MATSGPRSLRRNINSPRGEQAAEYFDADMTKREHIAVCREECNAVAYAHRYLTQPTCNHRSSRRRHLHDASHQLQCDGFALGGGLTWGAVMCLGANLVGGEVGRDFKPGCH